MKHSCRVYKRNNFHISTLEVFKRDDASRTHITFKFRATPDFSSDVGDEKKDQLFIGLNGLESGWFLIQNEVLKH